MNILLIEPFYSGSHKQFADQLQKYSHHNIQLLTLEGRFWKWRMYGAAITLGRAFIEQCLEPDLILATDMLNLPVFISTVRKHLSNQVPIVCYFHENQLTYPWRADSIDKHLQRDLHFGMLNYQTAMAADHNLFNSAHNMDGFFDALKAFLKKMPDHKHTAYIDALKKKSTIMPLGLELEKKAMPLISHLSPLTSASAPPLILWNHRWEHDKNPEDFFDALEHLKKQGIPFRLAVLGEQYKSVPEIFDDVPERFFNELIHFGYAAYEQYLEILNSADLLPVTSNHDFFGISVMEAIHCGATPLLPKRLAYVELYHPKIHPELFYDNQKDLIEKLTDYCQNFQPGPRNRYRHLTNPYDWRWMIERYDNFFDGYSSDKCT